MSYTHQKAMPTSGKFFPQNASMKQSFLFHSPETYSGFGSLVFQLVQVSLWWPYCMQSCPSYIHSKYCFRDCFLILPFWSFHTLHQTLKASMETASDFRVCSKCLPLRDMKCFLKSPSLAPTDGLVCRRRAKTWEKSSYSIQTGKISRCNSVFFGCTSSGCWRSFF